MLTKPVGGPGGPPRPPRQGIECANHQPTVNSTFESDEGIRELTPDQGRELLNRQAQRYLRMSGEQFIAAWRRGDFNGKSDSPDVMRVAMLLPLAGEDLLGDEGE